MEVKSDQPRLAVRREGIVITLQFLLKMNEFAPSKRHGCLLESQPNEKLSMSPVTEIPTTSRFAGARRGPVKLASNLVKESKPRLIESAAAFAIVEPYRDPTHIR